MSEKINVYISSKNRKPQDQINNFTVTFSDGLLKADSSEFFNLTVCGFHTINCWYNCNSNNNNYQIVFRNVLGRITQYFNFYLNTGNPSVYDILKDINNILNAYLITSYDSIKNIYTFTRSIVQDSTFYYMYIKPINSGSFFGFNNNVEYEIKFTGTTSIKPINVIGISKINIVIDGDIIFSSNNLHNYRDTNMEPQDIILSKAVDVQMNHVLKYENYDGGDSFQFKMVNYGNVKYLSLSVYDQDMNLINDLTDYSIHLQFTKHKTEQVIDILKQIRDYIKEIYLINGFIFEMLDNYIKMFKYFLRLIYNEKS
jgi:hypothetical protein